jgi:hypothetical protein
MPNYLRKEWESIKKYDVLFLVAFKENLDKGSQKLNVDKVRGCEVVAHLDEDKNKIEEFQKGNLSISLIIYRQY